ncbi:MAG: hypothetical protein LW847_03550 [Burkholderiales bacterium]|jgi:hypothetical protein|nr:hypothetical protein [Burkholderiales bacterium]
MSRRKKRLTQALAVLTDLGLPRAQQNERTALCLLALLDLRPARAWAEAGAPLVGITPIMDWSRKHYAKPYAPNTRETFRRQSMHQFVQAGIALYNPDDPARPVNSPHAVYQIAPDLLDTLRTYETPVYRARLDDWLARHSTLSRKYARDRAMKRVPVRIGDRQRIQLSAGAHSALIKAVIEKFAPRFAPGGALVYVGDTGDKFGYFDAALLARLGVALDSHGKMPDVVVSLADRDWLLLIEAVTSHGPVDGKRHVELAQLFASCTAGLVYVSAFPDRKTFQKHFAAIAWETEVWIADAPSHLIHFNGARFLGPYDKA